MLGNEISDLGLAIGFCDNGIKLKSGIYIKITRN